MALPLTIVLSQSGGRGGTTAQPEREQAEPSESTEQEKQCHNMLEKDKEKALVEE